MVIFCVGIIVFSEVHLFLCTFVLSSVSDNTMKPLAIFLFLLPPLSGV